MPEPVRVSRHQVAEGLRLLQRLGGEDVTGSADYRLYAGGPDPVGLDPKHRESLNKLGWHWERLTGCWVLYLGGKP